MIDAPNADVACLSNIRVIEREFLFVVPIATVYLWPWADLAAWHLPRGPVGLPSRWAATSNVEVGHTTYPLNRGSVRRKRRKWSQGQSQKEEEREGGSGTGEEAQGPLAQEEGGALLFSSWLRH